MDINLDSFYSPLDISLQFDIHVILSILLKIVLNSPQILPSLQLPIIIGEFNKIMSTVSHNGHEFSEIFKMARKYGKRIDKPWAGNVKQAEERKILYHEGFAYRFLSSAQHTPRLYYGCERYNVKRCYARVIVENGFIDIRHHNNAQSHW